MGLFDWLFASKPKWIPVTEENIKTDSLLTKADTKATFRLYLKQCGFDKHGIASEVEAYADEMKFEEESIKDDIEACKEDIGEAKENLNNLKKTKKNEDGELLEGVDYDYELESLEDAVADAKENLKESQAELKKLKRDWKPFLINYINDQVKATE
ncbi:MAG: hypothetical protein IH886_15680 [Nitrospinae bacterium]|nr:hypothetical protein [Nitrospinota bacterium]